MSMVYFKSNNTIVTMDNETSISVSKSNTVATNSVMSSKEVSTDLIEGNLLVSISGNITYSKSTGQDGNPTPSEWIDLIENAISNKERFTLYSASFQQGKTLLKNYPDMVIQDYGYVVDRFEDTITARITFSEVFVTASAKVTKLPPAIASDSKSTLQAPTKDGNGTSTDKSEEDTNTILRSIVRG
jgi:hypothetical protein